MFYRLIIILLLSIPYISKGQSTIVKHFTTEDGLAHDITYDILQDDKGYIWIATDDGLSRFDGQHFTNYNNTIHASDYLISLNMYKNHLLLGTWGSGVLKFNNGYINILDKHLDNQKVRELHTINDSILFINTIRADRFQFYNLDSKTYNSYGIDRIDSTKLKINKKKPTYNTPSLLVNKFVFNDTIWVTGLPNHETKTKSFKGTYIYNYNKHILIPGPKALSNMYIRTIYKKGETLWAINKQNELLHLKNEILQYRIKPKNISGKIIKIYKFQNILYLLSDTYTLYAFDLNTKQILNLSKAYNISASISNVYFDKNNHLWVTTNGNGIYRIEHKDHVFIDHSVLPNANIVDVTFTDSNILAISNNHLSKLTQTYTLEESTEVNLILAQFDPYVSAGDISIFGHNQTTHQLLYEPSVILTNKRNWIAKSDSGLVRFSEDSIHFYTPDSSEIVKEISFVNYINHVIDDEEFIYCTYSNNGLYKYDFKGNLIQIYDKTHGLLTNKVNDVIIDQDTLWFATNIGLVKAYDSTFVHFDVSNGLLATGINAVYKDKHNVLWIGTQKGLSLFVNNMFYGIGKCSGLQSSYISRIKSYKDHLYICGNKGIFVYNNTTAFTPHSNTTLNINQKDQQFTFDKTNFVNHKSIQTAYSINNSYWKIFKQNQLSFTHFNEGEYSIQFKYRDHTSNWIYSKPFTFSIRTPWYTSPWFYSSLIGCISLVIILLIYRQLKHVEKKNIVFQNTLTEREILKKELQDIRANIARDFHDDLGNKLASISILSKMEYDKRKQKKGEHLDNILQIQQEADALYGGMRDFIWTLDDANNNLQELQTYLTDFGEQLFEHSSITFISTHALPDMDIPLPYYWNKQLILIFKEGMTNSLKHSKANTVTLNVDLKDNILEIQLKDNGTGFNYNQLKRINGLNNMKSRIQSLNAELSITSTDGVTICFRGNINPHI